MSEFIPKVVESKGKTIDEAIANGLKMMGFSIDEVSIETVQVGTKGILGIGAKPYIVKLTQKDNLLDFMSMDYDGDNKKEIKHANTRPIKPQRQNDEGSVREFKANSREYKGNSNHGTPRHNNYNDKFEYTQFVDSESNCKSAQYLYKILSMMDIDAKLRYNVTDNCHRIKIDSDSMGVVIGHRGETLDALQYLTSLSVNKGQEDYVRVILDTENYRSKREETLRRLARKVASNVRTTNRKFELDPMNPYERRILHASLQNNSFVDTFSVGEEPNRRVVVVPKNYKKK